MIELHPEIIEKDGKKQFVILAYEEYLAIEEALADAEDLTELRAAKEEEHDAPSTPLEQVVEELGLHKWEVGSQKSARQTSPKSKV
jgi:hypothetical protein